MTKKGDKGWYDGGVCCVVCVYGCECVCVGGGIFT